MNLAIQNGLHTYRQEDEFVNKSRSRMPASDTSPALEPSPPGPYKYNANVVFRTRIWAHCVVTFQRYDTSSVC